MTDSTVIEISVPTLAELCNPLKDMVWSAGRVTRADVKLALRQNDLRSESVDPSYAPRESLSKQDHVARIAYLVKYGWNDPIQIDVGVPALGVYVDWMIIDGNHRMAAAIYRNDSTISSEISGSILFATEIGLIYHNENSIPV